MEQAKINELGDELYSALTECRTIAPLTSRGLDISIEDAYHIQQRMIARRIEKGERVVGKKNWRDQPSRDEFIGGAPARLRLSARWHALQRGRGDSV